MGIPLSSLPPDLQKRLLEEAGKRPKTTVPERKKTLRKAPSPKSTMMHRCVCGFEIFRPDGVYPERCDGCGKKSP